MLCNFSYLFPSLVYLKTLIRECLYLIAHGRGGFLCVARALPCFVLMKPTAPSLYTSRVALGRWQAQKNFVVLLRLLGQYRFTASNHSATLFFTTRIQAPSAPGLRKRWLFRRVRKIAKSYYYFRLSACPHGTTRRPLDRFPWNLIFEYFSKICRENSSFIKM